MITFENIFYLPPEIHKSSSTIQRRAFNGRTHEINDHAVSAAQRYKTHSFMNSTDMQRC